MNDRVHPHGLGHTMVEMLVALTILAVLAAGLMRYLGGAFWALGRVRDSIEVQRSLRRALDDLSDDVQEMGFLVPFRAEVPVVPLFSLRRDQPVKGPKKDPAAFGEFLTDELTFVKDVVLPGEARLDGPLGAGAPYGASVTAQRKTKLQRGDVLMVEDRRWEGFTVSGEVELPAGKARVVGLVPLRDPGSTGDHAQGAPVAFIRPLRRVTYVLCVHRPEDARPSLLRSEEGGDSCTGETSSRVVARNITAFRVELPKGPGAGIPPVVRITLEARSSSQGMGVSRAQTLARVPRNSGDAP